MIPVDSLFTKNRVNRTYEKTEAFSQNYPVRVGDRDLTQSIRRMPTYT